jgi:hypothetical protein
MDFPGVLPPDAAPPLMPAVYEIAHSNEGAPSNEQGLLSKFSTVGRMDFPGVLPPDAGAH